MAIHLRKIAVRAWLIVLSLLLGLIVVLVTACAYVLGTESGRLFLLGQVEIWLPQLTNQRFEAADVRSPSLGEWHFGRLVWAGGQDGPRVQLNDVTLEWQPTGALQRRLRVERLAARSIDIDLPRPAAPTAAPQAASSPLQLADLQALWSRIPPLRIDRFTVDRLTVDQPGRPTLVTAVDSEWRANWGASPARLALHLSHDDNELNLDVALDAADALRVTGDVRAASGSAWARWLQWPLQEDIAGRWDVLLTDANGEIRADIERFRVPWRGYRLDASGGVSYAPATRRVFFSELDVAVDDAVARIHGFIESEQGNLNVSADAIPLDLVQGLVPIEDLTGEVSVGGRLTGGWSQPSFQGRAGMQGRLAGSPLTVSSRSSATPKGVVLDSLSARWGEAGLEASGRVDWVDPALDIDVEWSNLGDAHWRPWLPAWPSDLTLSTSGQARITGTPADPNVEASVGADGRYREQPLRLDAALNATRQRLAVGELQLSSELGAVEGELDLNFDSLALQARTQLRDVRSDWLKVFGIEMPVAQDVGLSGDLAWSGTITDPLAEGQLSVDGRWNQRPLQARITVDSATLDQLTVGPSELTLADTQAAVSGQVDWRNRRLDLGAELTSLWLRTIKPFLPEPPAWLSDLTGRAGATLAVTGPWLEPRVTGDLTFEGDWQSRPLQARLEVDADGRQRWLMRQAELTWGGARLGYQGELRPFDPSLEGQFTVADLTVAHVSALPMLTLPAPFGELSGTAQASGQISGPLTAPTVSGQAQFNGEWQQTPVTLSTAVDALTSERVSVRSLELEAADAALNVAGEVAFRPLSLALDAELDQLNWSRIKPFIPQNLALPLDTLHGTSSGRVRLEGTWPAVSVAGELNSRGDYLDQDYRLTWAGSGNLEQQLRHQIDLVWGEAELQARVENQGEVIDGQLSFQAFRAEQARALGAPLAEHITGAINAEVGVSGEISDPVINADIDASGRWQPASGEVFEQSWSIAVNAEGRLEEWRIDDGQVDLGEAGRVSVSGEGTLERIDLSGRFDVPDTAYWLGADSAWNGDVAGRFDLAGSASEPSLAAQMQWRSERWPVAMNMDLETVDQRHRLSVRVTEEGTERLLVELRTPQTALSEWREDLPNRAFSADLDLNADSTVFAPFFQERPDQAFTGQLTGELSISGSLSEPQWEGEARLSQGRYENANYGTVLAGMDATLRADNRTLQLDFDATDNNGGTITLDGAVVWPEEREQWWMPELDMALNTSNARLMRRADIDATVSGELTVTGPWRDLTVAGLLDVTPLTIQLESLLQTGTPTLNVVRPEAVDAAADEPPPTSDYAPAGQWQVRLRADRRAQIYGQGLEAELSGELDLTDDLGEPNVGGRFEVVRGIYTAFGKNFRITRGTIQVQGSQLSLDILAIYEGPDLRVELNVAGTQDRLDLTLTSNPPLANEELLARLLFGKRIEEMTPVQALQLASALNSLRNPGTGLDLFGTTRDLLGLDTLTVDTGTTEEGETGVNVAAGKYLSNRLYLEVESDVGADQLISSSLRFQVTPEVQLELYSKGVFGAGGLQLNWSNDY